MSSTPVNATLGSMRINILASKYLRDDLRLGDLGGGNFTWNGVGLNAAILDNLFKNGYKLEEFLSALDAFNRSNPSPDNTVKASPMDDALIAVIARSAFAILVLIIFSAFLFVRITRWKSRRMAGRSWYPWESRKMTGTIVEKDLEAQSLSSGYQVFPETLSLHWLVVQDFRTSYRGTAQNKHARRGRQAEVNSSAEHP